MQRATLFILTGPHEHLHVVMNDPAFDPVVGAEMVLLVNICSIKPNVAHDTTCELIAGCHPFITHPSYVDYYHAVLKRAQPLEDGIRIGDLRTGTMTSEPLYRAIRSGFLLSPNIPRHGAVMRFFRQNGL
jgi:hypothetical protein